MNLTIERDLAAFSRLDAVDVILKALVRITGMRISIVARVTADDWTACAVRDEAEFGLQVGDKLDVSTTY